MPINYNNTKIYKIWSPQTEQVYIGATVQSLSNRMTEHRKPSNNTRSKIIIDLGDARIELVEQYSCNNKMESDKKEGEYIRKMNCVNKQIAGRTHSEYRDDNKDKTAERDKAYHEKNKEKLAERNKAWREANKEKIAEQSKAYREANTEKMREKSKEYHEKNKEKLAENRKIYDEKNKEKISEQRKAWYEANGDIIREKGRARDAIRREKAKLATIDELI